MGARERAVGIAGGARAQADTYPAKDPVAGYLQAYADTFHLPVRLNARVTHLSRTAEGFEIRTDDELFRARQVVVATGPFQVPFMPRAAQRLDGSVTQLHSASYRNPGALPAGPVLVVGGGNSGFQIAEELATTRQVDLSIGTKLPRCRNGSRAKTCSGGSPGSGCCGCPPAPGWAAECSGKRASGSGRG